VHRSTVNSCSRNRARHTELDKSLLRDVLNPVSEFVVEDSQTHSPAAIQQHLIDSALITLGPLRTNRAHMVLRNQLSTIRQTLKQPKERSGLIQNARFLDAFSITGTQFRSAEESP